MTILYRFNIDDDGSGSGSEFECNSFGDMVKLNNYNDIIWIDCSSNNLTQLPKLPNGLLVLWCENNQLEILPELPICLKELYCYRNQLKSIPKLATNVTELWCFNNNIKILPSFLPNSLTEIYCNNNNLQILPPCLETFKFIDYSNNPVCMYIREKCGGNLEIYYRENQIFATKLVRWYLDCRENPVYKYCRDRLNKKFDMLLDDRDNYILVGKYDLL
jgi:hypothetical protein